MKLPRRTSDSAFAPVIRVRAVLDGARKVTMPDVLLTGLAVACGLGPRLACDGLAPGQQQVMDDLCRRVRAAARSCLTWAGPAIVIWPRPPRSSDLAFSGTGSA